MEDIEAVVLLQMAKQKSFKTFSDIFYFISTL